jgi:rhodanese-related sulfurtransferase
VALQLSRKGIDNIRLLEGGYDGWRERGYSLERAA